MPTRHHHQLRLHRARHLQDRATCPLRIGPDVSVIGHDDLPASELLDRPLATIRLDGREMGRALMARLLGGDLHGDYVARLNWSNVPPCRRPGYLLTRCSPRSVRQLGNEP
jgi:hypothetical protein